MSKRRMDVINVIDVEATCWPGKADRRDEMEIIEIGNCQLDTRTEIVTRGKSVIIKPTHSEVSEFCTTLTGHTAESLERDGYEFYYAVEEFRLRMKTQKYLWASWGDFDRHIFERQCAREDVRYPFGPTHFNVKALYALMTGRRKQPSLLEAVEELGWKFEGRPHNGQDDTNNIARVLAWVLRTMRIGVEVEWGNLFKAPGNEQLRGR